MVRVGKHLGLIPARQYEDLASLKKWIRSRSDYYKMETMNEYIVSTTQLSGGAAAEIEHVGTACAAIAQIGKTEIAVKLGASGDDASTNTVVFTLVYTDADGDSHTATATGTAGLDTTQVAFSPAVADFYCATSFTSSTTFANVNAQVETSAGAVVWATITAAATAATEAQLLGVGAVYARANTNHNDADNDDFIIDYVTPWGEVKHGFADLDADDSTTEVRFYEATYSATTGAYTKGTTTVKDFYRILRTYAPVAPTANNHDFLVTDAACANVDGSGGDVYACLQDLYTEGIYPRWHCKQGYDTWIAKVVVRVESVTDGGEILTVKQYFTPDVTGMETNSAYVLTHANQFQLTEEAPVLLADETDVYWTIEDAEDPETLSLEFLLVEVERK